MADLESLLSEYKSSIKALEAELDAIGGDSSSLGLGKTREQLQSEIEESNSKIETLETGMSSFSPLNHVTHSAFRPGRSGRSG